MAAPEKSNLERVSGALSTQLIFTSVGLAAGGATAIGAFLGGLLPPLVNSLAHMRAESRREEVIAGMREDAQRLSATVAAMPEETFRLTADIALAVVNSTDSRKLDYLRAAFRNSIPRTDISSIESTQLSRIIRDISFDEIEFLTNNFQVGYIIISNTPELLTPDPNAVKVRPGTLDAHVIRSLANLGVVLEPLSRSSGDAAVQYEFSWLSGKLLALLTQP